MIKTLFRMPERSTKAHLVVSGEPSLVHPVSQACTQSQMTDPAYAWWCAQFREEPRMHRKQWEFCYILQALARNGMIAPGMKGLGFGVGEEPISAVLAARGVEILATDLQIEEAVALGWVDTAQHAGNLAALNNRAICAPNEFNRLVSFRSLDMNAVPEDVTGFDFCWSACALEHLGSINKGLQFIERSLDCLKPGGVAVHTTEFNCSSDGETLDNTSTVLFRRSDFLELAGRLQALGHEVTLNFEIGNQPLDRHIDMPPYSQDNHLKLMIEPWVTTSFGVTVRKLAL
jgi:SAM-dependent methyltransferase